MCGLGDVNCLGFFINLINSKKMENSSLGKHSYDKERAKRIAKDWDCADMATFSIGIFQWVNTSDGKRLKPSKTIVRVSGATTDKERVFEAVEKTILLLDLGQWNNRKTVSVK